MIKKCRKKKTKQNGYDLKEETTLKIYWDFNISSFYARGPALDFGKYDKVSFVKMKHNFIKYLINADKTIKGPFVQILMFSG